ncbi:hypothetical protein LXL04_016111 [Taraxacum kok-saghyz]
MDYTGKQRCILCNSGGELLVCHDNGCPIYVHENCMGCKPYMDSKENFICPYCIYRKLSSEVVECEKKVMVAKQQLSIFLDQDTSKGSHHEQDQGEEILSKDKTCLQDKNNVDCDDVESQCEESKEQSQTPNKCGENPGNKNINTCRIMVIYTPNSNPDDACGLDSVLHKGGKKKGVQLESDHVSKKPRLDNQTDNSKAKVDESADDHTDAGNIINNQERANKESLYRGTLIQLRKISRVLWTEEEVDKLKEGVEKYSQTTRKNLPWRKILEFGHDVFSPSRTPSDLKDKWRKITK